MKYCFLILLVTISSFSYCQKYSNLPGAIIVKDNNIPLRNGPSHESELISRVPINETLTLIGVNPNGYFQVKNERFDGYIFYMFVGFGENILNQYKLNQSRGPNEPLDELAEIRRNDSIADIINKRAKEESKPYLESLKKEIENKKAVFVKKYGPINGEKVAKGLIWIGMTEQMLIDSWGRPDDINTTVTRYGTSKQFVYGLGRYVYVENGKVDAWQN